MSDSPPGHPDELREMLTNWLAQANDPIGSLPAGVTAVEWAVSNFIAAWRRPLEAGIDSVEQEIAAAVAAIDAGDLEGAKSALDNARQTLAESVRDELGLYDWNRDEP